MKKSLRLKLLFMFLLTLALALAFTTILQFGLFPKYYLNHVESRLLSIYELVEEQLLLTNDSEDFLTAISNLNEEKQVGITVADGELRNAITTQAQLRGTENHLNRDFHSLITKERKQLESTHVLVEVHSEETPPQLVFVKKLSSGSYCILTHPIETLESNLTAMNQFQMLTGLLACIMSVFMTFLLSKQFTKPIIEMSEVTESLSQLDFQQKITYSSENELGQLATSINRLSQNLEEHKTALKNEIALQKVLTQNMSHELKTPISVMKGYLEALSFGVVEDKESVGEYIEVVLSECDRMNELINQMLHLSKLSSYQGEVLEKETFFASKFMERVYLQYKGLLHQKQIHFTQEILDRKDFTLWASEELLLQAFGNFLTNAVKYGDQKELRMSIVRDGSFVTLSLFNTGTPVPEEDQASLFDIFYMVDKVRSRENNSHGLGLSVTKTIADLHQGTVGCFDTDDGMCFYMKIPRKRKSDVSSQKNNQSQSFP